MKNIKSDAKPKFPTDPPKVAESGPNIQSQPSPMEALVPYPEKIKTPGMNDKRRSKDRVFTCFVESPSALLARLLNANLVKRILVHQPDQHSKNYNQRVWCVYHFNVVSQHTNMCRALKHKIQDLVDEGVLYQMV